MPAPMIMPHMRCRPCRPRQAIAITSALSPDNSTLIQMILPTASQNAGVCMSAWTCLKKPPMFAGSTTCNSQFTACPPPWAARRCQSADDFVAGEELRDLDYGRLGCVGTMHRVFADRFRVQLADRALRRLGGIGRAHDVPV